MPFPKWAVEPVFLNRKPLPPDKGKLGEFSSVTNAAFVNCLRQLASIAKIADKIFDEIGSECRLVVERTERLKEKVNVCEDVVSKLNARAVKVPVSDLSETARILRREKPYCTKYEQATQLFLPSTRTPCVDKLYQSACTTPVAVICTIDRYRTDGLSSSELFMVTPVLGGTRKKKRRLLDIETRKPANFSLVKQNQDSVKFGTPSFPTVVSPSIGFTLRQNENLELERLPSPEEQAMLLSLEYPSTVVPVDTSGANFARMSLLRRSLMHADFIIKRKKSKKKSKRRHTICEGQSRELEKALRNVANSSCQTDDMLDVTSISSSATVRRSLSKRRSKSVMDNFRRRTSILDELGLESLKNESKDSATEEDKEKSPSKASTISTKKSKTSSCHRSKSYSFNPISSLSAAISIAAVKMRNSSRGTSSKQDDGRSSSGNWSASSSTRASVDSDHQHAVSPVDGVSSPSRNSIGKDSVLSDATQLDQHNRSRDEVLTIQSLTNSPVKRKKQHVAVNLPWTSDAGSSRTSNTPTPEFSSLCSSSTPVVHSPYAGRRGVSDDGDSSVYSVDTDGYYTSMHTDSGLWSSALHNMKADDIISESEEFRLRRESDSSVSTIDNGSINSFLSKSATECSSNSGSLKRQPCPQPPPRASSCKQPNIEDKICLTKRERDINDSDKSYSPHPPNGSASESEHEVRDRIRVKTAITAHRYPSMCAVSPETSDEEITEMKNKILASNVNVVIAEVHQEEKSGNEHIQESGGKSSLNQEAVTASKNDTFDNCIQVSNFTSSINMYRSETPVPSTFSSTIQSNQFLATSTPRSGVNITTFSPDLNANNCTNDSLENFEIKSSHSNTEQNSSNINKIAVSENLASPGLSDKSFIPLKYTQRITVTPIARNDSANITGTVKRTPLKHLSSVTDSVSSSIAQNVKIGSSTYNKPGSLSSYISFKAPDSPVLSSSFIKASKGRIPSSPTNSLDRPVARVTLDPSGKVVYSSNSLGRINDNKISHSDSERSYATLPLYQAHSDCNSATPLKEAENAPNRCVQMPNQTNFGNNSCTNQATDSISRSSSQASRPQQTMQNQSFTSCTPSNVRSRDFSFRPSRGGRICRSYFPTHLISPSSNTDTRNIQQNIKTNNAALTVKPLETSSFSSSSSRYSGDNSVRQSHCNQRSQIPTFQMKNTESDSSSGATYYPNLVPNKNNEYSVRQNTSSSSTDIWPGRIHLSSPNNFCSSSQSKQVHNKTADTFHNTSSKKAEVHSSFASLRPPDLIPSGESPPSTLDITSPAGALRTTRSNTNSNLDKSSTEDTQEQNSFKSMSATELFAIIHSSKKKHNIKTESELSMSPLSSRSVSPALSQSSLPKSQPVETGVFFRRNENSPSASDKGKWCNSMPTNLVKKQTVQDKFGSTKPTSMHDFKMLLLQTRTGCHETSPRPSAAELLKVSPVKKSPTNNNSSKVPVSSSTFKSPISHLGSNISYSPGHGTVPLKRNFRTRSPYLSRYDSAYPPILEDCSEEMESNHEDNKCLISNTQSSQVCYKIPELRSRAASIVKATSTWV